jgi:hypothetical protein
MKPVFSSPDSAGVGLAQSILEAAGIACEVRNDAVSQSVPGAPFNPELWVLRDADYEESPPLGPLGRGGGFRETGVTRRLSACGALKCGSERRGAD